MHERDRNLGFAQRRQHVQRIGLVMHDRRGAHVSARLHGLAGQERRKEVARLDDARRVGRKGDLENIAGFPRRRLA